jgi:predicted anti-sigma-YlaC factor YlaD
VNCREALELLDDSLDGTLQARAGWRLKLHLWICRHCRHYLDSYKTTVRLEKAAFDDAGEAEPEVPEELVSEITQALRHLPRPVETGGNGGSGSQPGH